MRSSIGAGRTIRMAVVAAVLGAGAQVFADDLSREIIFASGLVEMGFPDFAERLVDRLSVQYPDIGDRVRPVQIEILISRRRFEEAEKLANDLEPGKPATDAAWLAIATGKHQIGELEAARRIYQSFFDRHKDDIPSDPDVRRFYMDAAYRFGQMLERTGELTAAAAAYERVLKAEPPPLLQRRMQHELAALYVRAARTASGRDRETLFKKAADLCAQIQWGEMDLWFGKSIITLAHIELIKEDSAAAEKLIRSYLDILNQIETMLTEQGYESALSPLAGARYLLGEINRKEAEKIEATDKDKAIQLYTEALRQFVNVFARYSDSEWGMDAGVQGEEIQAKLEAMGRSVRIDWGKHAAQASAARFRLADKYFGQRNYAEAKKVYLQILNRFPDTDQTHRALANLLMSQAHLDEEWEMRATAEHIAERYARNPDAGIALLIAGRHFFDADKPEQYRYFYDLFIRAFPRHPRAPAIAFTLAGLLQKRGDTEGQRKYLDLLIRDYEGDVFQHRALGMLAWNRYTEQDYEGAEALFRQVVEKSVPSHDRAVAQFTRADCLMRLNRHTDAIREFEILQQWLATERDNPYGATSDEIRKNRDMVEKARFFIGFAYARAAGEGEALAGLRQQAVQNLEVYLQKYPSGDLASRAMSVIGGVQLEMGRTADAAKTFEDLARRYPATEEGRNALFSLIRAAVEVNKLDIARDAFRKMMAERDAYGLDQILRVAQWMLDISLFEEAFEGFQMVMATDPVERGILERTLYGLGRSAYETQRFDVATDRLKALTSIFPNTGFLFDARLALARSFRALGRLEEAVEALRDVFERATDRLLGHTANIELARMQKILADRAHAAGQTAQALVQRRAAVASYQRIALFANVHNADERPFVQEALLESIRLFTQMEDYRDVIENCDQFLRDFPDSEEVPNVRRIRAEANLRVGAR